MIAAVVLAAGASRRLGQPKQLVQLAGEALLRRAARQALEAGCSPVIAVLPGQPGAYLPALEGLAVQVCPNAHSAEGMGASIRAGVAALPAAATAVLLLTVDQVAVDTDLLRGLIQAHRDRGGAVASAYAGRLGVPALFPREAFPKLLASEGDRGARDLLAGAAAVPFPRGGEDLDTPEDLLRFTR